MQIAERIQCETYMTKLSVIAFMHKCYLHLQVSFVSCQIMIMEMRGRVIYNQCIYYE